LIGWWLLVVLVGPGESGKSTIFKQMKIIQIGGGFSQNELLAYRYIVYGNCITQMKVIVAAAEKLGIELESPETKVCALVVAVVVVDDDDDVCCGSACVLLIRYVVVQQCVCWSLQSRSSSL
jgi:hypothetical protein